MSPERRNVILALLAAFVFGVSGGVVGTLGTLAVLHHLGPGGPGGPFGPQRGMMMRRHGAPGEPGGPGGMRAERAPMERLLAHHLDLTEEQKTRIEKILDDARPRYAAVRESTHAEIERVLTPAQREKFKEIESRFPARRRGAPAAP